MPDARNSGGGELSFTTDSAALHPDTVVSTACQFCNSNCRLKVGIRAGRVISVSGDPDDPVQAGNFCVKASMMPELAYSSLRLRTPLRRVSGTKGSKDSKFEPISWDTALDLIADRLLQLRDSGQVKSIANRTTGRLPRGTGSLVARLFALLGSPNNTDVGPVCNDAGGNALAATFGLGNFTNGYGVDGATGREDLGAAKYFLFLGTNQAETHPVTFDYLLRSRKKTHAKVVVDPRRTPTGAAADTWIAPKPHTDFALVLGMLQHIIARNLHDKAFVQRWVLGFAELRDHLNRSDYTPDWAAGVTGVPAATIRQIAEDYATAKPAAIFCNAGISHQLGAFDTYRVLTFLAAVTGNIGVPGGGCNFMHNTWPGDLRLPELTVTTPPLEQALPVADVARLTVRGHHHRHRHDGRSHQVLSLVDQVTTRATERSPAGLLSVAQTSLRIRRSRPAKTTRAGVSSSAGRSSGRGRPRAARLLMPLSSDDVSRRDLLGENSVAHEAPSA
ncbi:molybdopterin-dependent oxidoreductase [Amycolatopsis sp. NPDC051758]|uniref:molybdopterin-dependent oxidoreductase n=1 Tax=Amycolatopsis sp. NPDC051758 TaxID=3363935 RepID=UPI0037B7614A